MERGPVLLPGLAAAAASVFFGANLVAVRYVIAQTDPLTIAFLRHAVGTTLMLPLVWPLLRPGARARLPAGDLLALTLLGFTMFALFPYASSGALRFIPASRGALILTTMPLFTLGLAGLFGQERFTALKLAGIVLTIVGVALALGERAPVTSAAPSLWLGDGIMFGASFLGAVYSTFSPPYLRRHPPLAVTAFSMVCGTLLLSGLSWAGGVFGRWPHFTPTAWLAVAFIGMFGGALGYVLWVWAFRRMTPSRVVVYLSLNPLSATVLAALLLGETISGWFLTGLALVLSGIFLVNWERGRHPASLPAAPAPSGDGGSR